MKKWFVACLAVALMLSIGCGDEKKSEAPSNKDAPAEKAKAAESTPKATAQAWIDAVVAGDVNAAIALSTGAKAKEGNEGLIKAVNGEEAPPFKEVKQDGDKATVMLEDGFTIPLKKVDGEWKVDFNE